MRLSILVGALVAGYVTAAPSSASLATSSSTPSVASSSGSSPPAVHTITVGKGGNSFEPNSLNASVGDVVVFEFYPANHRYVPRLSQSATNLD